MGGVEAYYKLLLPRSLLSGLFFSPPTHIGVRSFLGERTIQQEDSRLLMDVYFWSMSSAGNGSYLRTQFLSVSMAFMIVYVWGRNFPDDRVDIHGFIEVKPLHYSLLGSPAGCNLGISSLNKCSYFKKWFHYICVEQVIVSVAAAVGVWEKHSFFIATVNCHM
ncbi:hypothetical protein POM88_003563 [Heracleum sosnowskyi]|uniref:Uncharacterized protein n=1 Tax=Heracleum sosnowskyi TaxID=360622 RepID=A0AAD8JHQ1_9APIA|nr:hypothetical protein POM88_003563 [Heracleum sosnowskyi]